MRRVTPPWGDAADPDSFLLLFPAERSPFADKSSSFLFSFACFCSVLALFARMPRAPSEASSGAARARLPLFAALPYLGAVGSRENCLFKHPRRACFPSPRRCVCRACSPSLLALCPPLICCKALLCASIHLGLTRDPLFLLPLLPEEKSKFPHGGGYPGVSIYFAEVAAFLWASRLARPLMAVMSSRAPFANPKTNDGHSIGIPTALRREGNAFSGRAWRRAARCCCTRSLRPRGMLLLLLLLPGCQAAGRACSNHWNGGERGSAGARCACFGREVRCARALFRMM